MRKYLLLELDYQAVSPAELEGREFDLAIDCSGSAAAMQGALPLLGKGGRLCVFGVANPQAELKVKPFEVWNRKHATRFRKNVKVIENLLYSFRFT